MRRTLLLPGVVLIVVMTACGGGATGSGVATLEEASGTGGSGDGTASAPIDTEAQMLAFAQCMRDEGIDMEDPTIDSGGNPGFGAFRGSGDPDGSDGPPEGFREALETCRPLLDGLELGFGLRDQSGFQDTLLEYARCMRDNGYDMADPELPTLATGDRTEGEPGPGGGPFGDVDFDDPVFQEAQSACSEILGGFGPGGGFRTGGSGSAPDQDN